MKSSIFGKEKDFFFMQQAMSHARQAYQHNEVPIGAVVVCEQGTIIGAGYNQVELCHTQRAHAESIAIEQAGASRDDWRLNGCWLYVTLEPCAMCIGLVTLSRMQGVVYAAPSPLFGYRLDKEASISVYNRGLLCTIEGVMQEEASTLLQHFFQQKRKVGGNST
jgi:tRNA(adenine34) deaminase